MDDMMSKIGELLGDEESMQQLRELSEMFGKSDFGSDDTSNNGGGTSDQSAPAFDFDIGKIMKISQLMQGTSDDANTQLLLALKPHLSEERQAKIDKAIKLLKLSALWTVLKDSGILNDLQKII